MAPHRVNILGASGAGASSLGRALAEALRAPYFDCDDYYHEPSDPPFQRRATPESRHARLVGDLGRQASWVLAGGVAGWEPYPQLGITQFVFLWVPPAVRIERLRRREQGRFGARVLPGGDMHGQHEEFVAWAARYDAGDVEGKTLARHEAYLAQQNCPVLEIRGEVATEEALRRVLAALATGVADRDAS
ncbi:MAG: adenylate kinase [Phycisphaerae bacterium]|nr:adenylate kinase [Phycisphaerae bacterium]